MKKIIISGYYGFGNIGDEAILDAVKDALLSYDSEVEITALSANPSHTADNYKIKAIPRSNFKEICQALQKTDLLISGGGGLLQDTTSQRSILYYLGIVQLAKLLDKKVMFYAQGIGPLNSSFSREVTKFVASQVDLITVRDEKSKDLLKSIGIKNNKPPILVTADPVTGMNPPTSEEKKILFEKEGLSTEKIKIGISVRHWNNESYMGIIKEVADYLIRLRYQVKFLPLHYPQDKETADKIIEQMENPCSCTSGIYSPKEWSALIGNFDLVIGMRLHGIIFAGLSSVPFIGLSYDEKVSIFAQLLGMPVYPLENLDSKVIIEQTENLLQNKAKNEQLLKENFSPLRKKALLNAQYAIDLTKGFSVREILV